MKRTVAAVCSIIMLSVVLCAMPVAQAGQPRGDQDFTLVNKTGVIIHAVYVSPTATNNWEEDILGQDVLDDGEYVDITFSRKETAKYWDLRVEDGDGNYIVWQKLNLLEISKVTLYYNNGKATAKLD